MKLKLKEICIFAILGSVMYVSKLVMQSLPNIHLIAVFIIAISLIYRRNAIYPIVIYILLEGLFSGFNLWWLPYLYLWPLLWAFALLLPKDTIEKKRWLPCAILCALHGYLYGTLYTPFMAIVYGFDFQAAIDWIIAGLSFDLIHGTSNLILSLLIIPIAKTIKLAANPNS